MKNSMKIVKDNENEVKNTAETAPATGEENLIKITPHFDQLTTKGVEIFKNMGEIENAKLWATDFAMEVGSESLFIPGLIVLLQAIADKIEGGKSLDHPIDFIGFLQDHLFTLTATFEDAARTYVQSIQSGDFIVDNLIRNDSPDEPQPEAQPLKAAA